MQLATLCFCTVMVVVTVVLIVSLCPDFYSAFRVMVMLSFGVSQVSLSST